MPAWGSLQNCDHQYRSSFKFALRIFCVSFLYMSMALSLSAKNASQHRRIIAYECMNPKCAQSFSNMHCYDVHRYHARNVGTLCASLTMRREIVATRRAGLTTAVIRRIPSKGKQCAWCIYIMTAAVLIISVFWKLLVEISQKLDLIRTTPEHPWGCFIPPRGVQGVVLNNSIFYVY